MKLCELQELLGDASSGSEGGEQPWLEAGSPRGGVAWTPLQFACALGDQELVAELLTRENTPLPSSPSNVNASSKTAFKYSPLHIAARFGHLEIVRDLLLAAPPADANAVDAQVGCSPLHLAVLNGDIEMARALMDDGKASQAPTKGGTTPLDLLDNQEQPTARQFELRQLLIDRKATRVAREQLSGWLAAVGMVEYASQFFAQGFDDPKFLLENGEKVLSDAALEAMGVTKPGHRSKLRALFGLREFLELLEGQSEEEEDSSGSDASGSGSDADEDESSGDESGSGSEEDEA